MKPTILSWILASTLSSSALGVTYDLKTDWSDVSNPNGPWSYLFENALAPGGTRGWDVFLDPPGPPQIWGIDDFYPGWSQSNGSEAVPDRENAIRDIEPGDIYAHSWNQGPVAVSWTSPISGNIEVVSSIWPLRDVDRANAFTLSLDGLVKASGTVWSGDPFSRDHPSTVGFQAHVDPGDVVLFSVLPDGTIDDYFGLNFTIAAIEAPHGTPVPDALPTGTAFAAVVIALSVVSRSPGLRRL